MNEAALEALGLEKRFGSVVALRGVDLRVPDGSLLALLGPNGAGKSTLLRLLSGLARPSRGSVRVGGETRDRRRIRAKVGLVAHSTWLYPELTARENLIFAARLHSVAHPAPRADALLAEHGLGNWAGRPAGTLSRGLAQRVAIARGLIHDPPVLLLDEPFSGLDAGSAERLVSCLRALRERQTTIVLASHDLGRVADLADRAVVLQRGRVAHETSGDALSAGALERAVSDAAP